MKTLPLRMAAHCEGAAAVAHYLSTHPAVHAVHAVHYPGLPGHPQHALAQRQLQGGFGGMVSFELARNERAAAAQVSHNPKQFLPFDAPKWAT